jgi:hypothetical protein
MVAILLMVIFLVVAGAFYLEIAASSRATDQIWMVSRSVSAGDMLSSDNVQRTRVPRAGNDLDYFTGDLVKRSSRASHDMAAGTILFNNDVLDKELALVSLTLRAAPPLAHGQPVDIYVQVGSQTMIMGRRLIVEQVATNNGGQTSNNTVVAIWVPAADEPSWITLQASNAPLLAARSTGVGVPQGRGQTMQDAISTLSGGSATGPPLAIPVSPSPTKKP